MTVPPHVPPRYLLDVAAHFETTEPELWAWFRSDDFQARYQQQTANDLLRSSVRLEPLGPNERRYALAEQAKAALGLTAPVALHQSLETGTTPNAFLVFAPETIEIVFQGRILELLTSDAELLDLLGHEMSHHKLFTIEAGRFHTVERLTRWVATRDGCPPEFIETWRRCSLFTEIYCDIGGLIACGDRDATISGLVKVIADFRDADARSYLAQARELLASGVGATRGLTHPELYVRVLAIAQAQVDVDDDAFTAFVRPLVVGPLELGALDVLDQAHLRTLTRRLLARALADGAFQHETAQAHARQFFPDLKPADPAAEWDHEARLLAPSATDYLVYLLLDLVTCDRSRASRAMPAAAAMADGLGIGARFREVVRSELKAERSLLATLPRRAAA